MVLLPNSTVSDRLLQRRYDVLGRNAPLFYDRPVHLVRGDGVWLHDEAGNRYLDVYNNVPCVGHCHPHVVEAIARQAATLNTHSRYLHEGIVAYAERLTKTFAPSLDAAMFTCSGTEANELAIRIARHHSRNQGLIVSDFSYHGNSRTLAELTTFVPMPEPFSPLARAVRVPDPYRDRQGRSDSELADRFAADVADAIKALQADGVGVAALLIDAFFANEGLPDPVPGYVEKAVDIVRAAGGLFICDEVQSGFARTGEAMWGHQRTGVVPDIATMGKPMGNGHPVAGLVASRELIDPFCRDAFYFNTFGGNPVSAAAANAVLDVIEREGLLQNSQRVGRHVRAGLERLQAQYPIIGNVRGAGLFFGLELVQDDSAHSPAAAKAKQVVNMMRERGILMSRAGRHDNILKMRPPLVFGTDHADLLLNTLDDVFDALN